MEFIIDFVTIAIADAILTRLFFPQTEIVISEPIEVPSEADKQQIEYLKGQITYANAIIKDQRNQILTAANDLGVLKVKINKFIAMAKALETENANLKAALVAKEESEACIENATFTVASNMEVPTGISIERLKAQVFNGDIKSALSTYNQLILMDRKPNLLEVVAGLEQSEWSQPMVDYKLLLEEFNPYGSEVVVRRRAVNMFINMAVFAKSEGRIELVALMMEAASKTNTLSLPMAEFVRLKRELPLSFMGDLEAVTAYMDWDFMFK